MALLSRNLKFRLINLYPPLIGARIRVVRADAGMTSIDVEMKLTWWNRNIVGTHFGGSLYAMCDPFFMAILMSNLGPDYIVWDKAASIRFLKPGRSHVRAHFEIPPEKIDEIRRQADTQYKIEPEFAVDVVDMNGETVAHVTKLLYVRRKNANP